MNNTIRTLISITWLVLAIAAIWYASSQLRKCEGPAPVERDTVIVTVPGDTVLISTTDSFYIVQPAIIRYVEVPADVDTAKILANHFAIYFYRDSIWSRDSSVFVVMNDSITQNRITYRRPLIQNLRATSITQITNTTTQPKTTLYGGITGTWDNSPGVNGALILRHSNTAYMGGYDPFNKRVQAGVFFELGHLRKPEWFSN